mgnify:CR=1 FL=1
MESGTIQQRGLYLVLDSMNKIKIHPPFFLAESRETCWKCGQSAAVYGFVASEIEDDNDGPAFEGPYFLRNIEELPELLARSLPCGTESFAKVSSLAAGLAYYANLCKCGANFGDHYLFSEPGGAFFPLEREGVAKIRLTPVDSSEALELAASYGTVPTGLSV